LTEAFVATVLSLAFIQNIRSGENFLAGAAGDALEFGNELGSLGGERFVLVEERVDDVGRDEQDEQHERQRDDPEVEPPAAGALANDGIENPGEQAANDDSEELAFSPIGSPGGPGLDGNFVDFQN